MKTKIFLILIALILLFMSSPVFSDGYDVGPVYKVDQGSIMATHEVDPFITTKQEFTKEGHDCYAGLGPAGLFQERPKRQDSIRFNTDKILGQSNFMIANVQCDWWYNSGPDNDKLRIILTVYNPNKAPAETDRFYDWQYFKLIEPGEGGTSRETYPTAVLERDGGVKVTVGMNFDEMEDWSILGVEHVKSYIQFNAQYVKALRNRLIGIPSSRSAKVTMADAASDRKVIDDKIAANEAIVDRLKKARERAKNDPGLSDAEKTAQVKTLDGRITTHNNLIEGLKSSKSNVNATEGKRLSKISIEEDAKTEAATRELINRLSGMKPFLDADKTSGNKQLKVIFNISESEASPGETLEKYELDFGDGSAVKAGAWPTVAAELEKLKSIEHTYSKSSTAKLTLFEKGSTKKVTKEVSITISDSSAIQASIEPSPASGKAPLTVKFDISKSHPSLGKTLDKYELDFNDGSAKKVGAWPSSVSSLTAIEHIYSKSSTAKLTVWEKGPDKTASATKQITITTGGGTVTPVEINNVLTGLGQIDKKFVDSLFK